jgi:hypothetical protein
MATAVLEGVAQREAVLQAEQDALGLVEVPYNEESVEEEIETIGAADLEGLEEELLAAGIGEEGAAVSEATDESVESLGLSVKEPIDEVVGPDNVPANDEAS